MSLTPKIDEVSCFMKTHNPDVACITETMKHGFKNQLTNRVSILLDTISSSKTVAVAVTVV